MLEAELSVIGINLTANAQNASGAYTAASLQLPKNDQRSVMLTDVAPALGGDYMSGIVTIDGSHFVGYIHFPWWRGSPQQRRSDCRRRACGSRQIAMGCSGHRDSTN